MLRSPKQWLRSTLRMAGYDVRRITVESDPAHQLAVALRRFEVETVFDVGANAGQFASGLRSAGYTGSIVSFEPLSAPHASLSQRARKDPLWTVHAPLALGERDGEITIHVAGNSLSSSALDMLPLHAQAAAESAYVGSETVALARLDSIAPPYLTNARNAFLKIDVQGLEAQVLAGAAESLPRFVGVLCELSLVPLYAGQPLWLELVEQLARHGYTLWSLREGFTDPRDGRTLQVDGTFFRKT